ncbi:hypothetical protein MASR2M66_29680 [Chloroflexota bacterium]
MVKKPFFSMVVLFVICIYGCKPIEYIQRDPFYKYGNGSNYLRFPLIKPYDAIYLDDGFGWRILLSGNILESNMYYYNQINDISKISVINKLIIVNSAYTQDIEEDIGEKQYYWFVLLPTQKTEQGFETESDLLSYLQMQGVLSVTWDTPDQIMEEFESTLCLDWIPNCK